MTTISFHAADGGQPDKERGICSVRALAIAVGIPWDCAYGVLNIVGRKRGRGVKPDVLSAALDLLHSHSVASCEPYRYNLNHNGKWAKLRTVLTDLPNGRFIVLVWPSMREKHVFAVIDRVVYDKHPLPYSSHNWPVCQIWQISPALARWEKAGNPS